MRKIIVMLSLLILLVSLTSSANAILLNPDPYIPCLPLQYVYTFPTTTIAGGQTVSFDLPLNPCPPIKIFQMGGVAAINAVDVDAARIDTHQIQYQCTLSSNQDCCMGGGVNLVVCALLDRGGGSSNFAVTTYDSQGPVFGPVSPGEEFCRSNIPISVNDRTATRFIVTNLNAEQSINVTASYYYNCCYDCKKKQEPPATILYPKVDIENFAVAGGAIIVKDGKLLSNFLISPGSQQTFIQVENRGFFTQNDARIRFEGLPAGVNVSISPESQKLKSQNIGTYSAIFTLDPNVPSGTYQVTMIAYSEKGIFDKIIFEFVVP